MDYKNDKGYKILMKNYKGRYFSKKEPLITEEEFEIAKKEGYMFDIPEIITHDEAMQKMRNALANVTAEEVAQAFLYSLSTKDLVYRSALASYWYAVSVPDHQPMNTDNVQYASLNIHNFTHCWFCGWNEWWSDKERYKYYRGGYNDYNYRRYKSLVLKSDIDFAAFDLEQFAKLPKVKATKEDKRILNDLLDCIYEIEKGMVGKYQDHAAKKKIVNATRDELRSIIEILGVCGVLAGGKYPCYADRFAGECERGPIYSSDWLYPVCNWSIEDRVNEDRFKIVFGYEFGEI